MRLRRLRANSERQRTTSAARAELEEIAMYPHNDPSAMLFLHHQHAAELRHQAATYRLARCVATPGTRHRNVRWWSRLAHRGAVRAPANP